MICRFDAFMREMDTRFPTTDTVFEYCVDPNQRGWLSWENKLSSNYRYTNLGTQTHCVPAAKELETLPLEVITAAAVPRSSVAFASAVQHSHGMCVGLIVLQ